MSSNALSRRVLLQRAAQFGALALLSGCGIQVPPIPGPIQPHAATPLATSGGTLRIGKPDDILLSGVPHQPAPANFQILNLIYDTLITYDRQLNPQPRLATNWTWSADYRQLSFELRPDAKFHTGRPFTSDDARFNLERVRDPSVGSPLRNYAELMHISTPSSDKLVITFDAPVRSSFDVLHLTFMADPQTLEQTRQGQQFVGTGPFRFQEWVPGDHLTVLRNADYWRPGQPYLDGVELHVIPDQQSALAALETRNLEWVTAVAGPDARRLQADPAYQVLLTGNGGQFYYLGLDVASPDLMDNRVRQAFGFALDRQRMVDTALYGFGRPASIPWPMQSLAYSESLDTYYMYDPVRARQMLSDAGWNPSTVLPIFVTDSIAVSVQMAEVAQADLANVGVRSVIQKLGQADFVSRLQQGQFGGAWIISMSWMQFSPATLFNTAYPLRVPNSSNFTSPRYEMLIDQSLAATDDQVLRQVLSELTQLILDEAFVVMIAEGAGQQSGPEVALSTVHNIMTDPFGLVAYQDLWLEK